MIGTGKRDEALRVLGSGEYAAGIVDTDRFIGRRMKYQQRFVQVANAAGEVLRADVVEQITANAERAPGECDLDLALALWFFDAIAKQTADVGRIERSRDRHHGPRFGNAVRRGE